MPDYLLVLRKPFAGQGIVHSRGKPEIKIALMAPKPYAKTARPLFHYFRLEKTEGAPVLLLLLHSDWLCYAFKLFALDVVHQRHLYFLRFSSCPFFEQNLIYVCTSLFDQISKNQSIRAKLGTIGDRKEQVKSRIAGMIELLRGLKNIQSP